MKKLTWVLLWIVLGQQCLFAQKSNIQSVLNYMNSNEIAEAKKMIDETVLHESTKSNAKAWLLRGIIYQAIATSKDMMPEIVFVINDNVKKIDVGSANALAAATPNALQTSLESYRKYVQLNPSYEKSELIQLLISIFTQSFNTGIAQMQENKFQQAYNSFGEVGELANIDNGAVWKGAQRNLDTIFANAKMYQGNCAYQMNDIDKAAVLLEDAAKSPYLNTSDLFVMLSEIYEQKGNEAKWLEITQAAKAKYPNDKRIINNEINYYLKTGKTDDLIKRLQDAIKLEPNKTDLYLILGQTYYNIANPEKGAKPTNAKDLEQNALTQYSKVAELEPNNYFGQFYSGLVYYNQAKNITDEMNKADDKKYASLKPVRDGLLDKALPYLEKSKTLIETEKISDANKDTYKQILSGLSQIYNITGKTDKVNAIQALIKSVQ